METATAPGPTPALYRTRVTHLHRSPVRHYAEHRSYSWYVDVDALPKVPWWLRPFARFEAADHFEGTANDTLRQRVDTFLARNGVHIPGGRVTALLMPRVLGSAFNPLSLFWCHDADGVPRCVVAEVKDARGGRSAYLLPAAEDAPAAVTEALRSAPFAGDDGYFLVRVPRPETNLDVTVSLHRDNHAALVATWRGARRRASLVQILLLQLTYPLEPQMARLSMRLQALALRRRGLPAAARPAVRHAERAPHKSMHPAAAGWSATTRSWAT